MPTFIFRFLKFPKTINFARCGNLRRYNNNLRHPDCKNDDTTARFTSEAMFETLVDDASVFLDKITDGYVRKCVLGTRESKCIFNKE